MEANSWQSSRQGSESAVDSGDWRSQLLPESRDRVVTKIMDTLKKHLPFNDGPEGVQELKKIASKFEEKIFFSATNQSDYLRKISVKMLSMDSKSNTVNSMLPNSAVSSSQNPRDSGSNSMQAQVVNQGQQIPMQTGNTQVQARQQLLSQNIQNSIAPSGVQGSSGLMSAMSSISGLPSANMPNVASQNPNLQNIQNMSEVSQNLVGNAMDQGISSSLMANSQRQIHGRQHNTAQQQQKQQSQNQQNQLYQQQLQQQQLMKPKYQQGNMSHSVMQSHMQQQQQAQPNIMQSSQQPSIMQSGSLSGFQQNQQINGQPPTQTEVQQNSQSVFRQQQQTSLIHHQQQTVQSNATNMQHQLTGQQNSISDMQQQQQRMLSQQNNLPNIQQQQQLTSQTNNLPNVLHQKMSSLNNAVRLPQQSLVTQSGNSNMQTNQHSLQMMQQSKVPLQSQSQQGNTKLFPSSGQPSQQSMAQIQSQTGQQQQLGMQQQQQLGMQQQQKLSMQQQQQLDMQQQHNLVQRDMQQRLQTSGPLLQQPNKINPQKQLFQSQRAISEPSATSLDSRDQNGTANSEDWREETYQKIKVMKETYLPELSEMYQRIGVKLQQHDSVPQQPKNEQIEKLKMFRTMLERLIGMLQISKSNILPTYGEKLPSYEKQILNVLNSSRKQGSMIPPGQHPSQSQMQSMQQQHSQITQMQQTHDNQMNAQLQQTGVQNSMSTIPQNAMTGQGNPLNNMKAVSVGSLQQNPISVPQQVNMNVLQPNLSSVQSNVSLLPSQHIKSEQQMLQTQPLKQQSNVSLLPSQHIKSDQQMLQTQPLKQQSNVSLLPSQHIKTEQQMLQTQPLKQQRQMQQQLLHRQMLQQQQQPQQLKKQQQQQPQQLKPQQHAQFQSQMNDINDLKMRQQLAAKSGLQPHSSGQRAAYQHQQMKSTASFTIPSPQILQAASPQGLQQPSPQIDQPNILSSLTKTGTPLQSSNSPLMVPSPSTPFVPSPIPGESENVGSGLSNTGNIRHHQASTTVLQPQSLAIGTPGISPSPLFESTSPENHANASAVNSGKSNVTELPIDRLMRVVKSMSPSALSGSVSDIGSTVGMFDRIAGSAPGNGSRAAVGEDLAAMTKCCLQANNFSMQDESPGMRKMRRHTTANFVTGSDASVVELTARSCSKRPRLADNHSLLEEIREINERLIDTVVDISDEKVDHIADPAEGGDGGTVVKCSYSAVALSPTLKSQYGSAQMLPIQPLRLLVPNNYPNCSPILLDKFPTEPINESEDLSLKAKSMFSIHLRTLSQPMSLGEIARTWDTCSRAVILEYAQRHGGGSFSSIYGTWENCLSAV